jgi:uncharacterized protein (DUF302 family)
MHQPLTYQIRIKKTFDEAVRAVSDALKSEGFGVLTKIDVAETIKEKLGEEFRPYVILGACNPPLAHRALTADPAVGVVLPCNVTVEQTDDEILVTLVNPEALLAFGSLADNPAVQQVAHEARNRIEQVAAHLRKA